MTAGSTGWETLDWRVDGDGVATLTLNRPDQLNAFDLTMAGELEQVFREDAWSDDVRAVVVTGDISSVSCRASSRARRSRSLTSRSIRPA